MDPGHVALALDAEERRLAAQVAADPRHLHRFEAQRFSQGGEDGIIGEIFERIGVGDRTFVELGSSDGGENCTRALADDGWAGVWVEGDPESVARARQVVDPLAVQVVQAFLDRDNVVDVLRSAGAPAEPDLMVIDLDGNDLWIWEAVASAFRPRVAVLEYNSVFGPSTTWAMPYASDHRWDDTCWFGVSLAAQAASAERFGYRLVGCDRLGVNAFYVREELAGSFSARSVRDHYVGPRYHLPFGHPPVVVPPLASSPPVVEGDLRLEVALPTARTLQPRERVYFDAVVHSGAADVVGESAHAPVRLATWWSTDAGRIGGEPARCIQPWRVAPGGAAALVGVAHAPSAPGSYDLHVGLVQESVAWLDGDAVCAGTWNVEAASP